MKNILKKIAIMLIIVDLSIFSIISIKHLIGLNEPLKFNNTSLTYGSIEIYEDMLKNCAVFIAFMGILMVSYLIILFNKKKENNFTKKHLIGIVVVVSILSFIILPNNSQDVYYYMSVGRLDVKYNVNIYRNLHASVIEEYPEDEIVQSSQPLKVLFAYGPLWYLVCKFFGSLPINSTWIMLYLYKLFIMLMHLLNAYIIFKMSKEENKIRNTLIYALNPLIIFEGLINAHNDMIMLTTMILAIYFKKKDNLSIAVLFVSLGALIKYVPILLLPYIINKEKSKIKPVLYIMECVLLYIIIGITILGSTRGLLAFGGQTAICMNSLYLLFFLNPNMDVMLLAKIGKRIFIAIYLAIILYMFIKKDKISEENKSNIYKDILLLFLFLAITNFRAWYLMWLFCLIPNLKENKINQIITISLFMEAGNIVMYGLSEHYTFGAIYFYFVIFGSIISILGTYLYKKVKNTKELKYG